MPSLAAYAVVCGAAALVTFVLTPVMRRVAVRIGAVVRPDERRVHDRPTPTLGGVAMLGGILVAMLVAWQSQAFGHAFSDSTEPLGVVVAAVLILVVGVIDDLRDVSAPAKIAGIVLAASILVLSGVSILVLRIPFLDTFVLSADWSYLLSVLWVVGLANAINLIDGLDGLASGIVGIASATFFVYAFQLGHEGLLQEGNIGPLLAVMILGACIGFLPHNFHPARIFMGDGGALLLGLMMAASTMVVGGRTDRPVSGQSFFFFAPLFIVFVILGVPILDTLLAIVRRAKHRTGVATADKDHLHHRLVRLGHGHRRSVLILWGWTALLSGGVLIPIYTGKGDGLVPIGILALGLVLVTVLRPFRSNGNDGPRTDHRGDDVSTPVDPGRASVDEIVGRIVAVLDEAPSGPRSSDQTGSVDTGTS